MSSTVVILGAGASADFGLPLGNGLYDTSLQTLQDFLGIWNREREKAFHWDVSTVKRVFSKEPHSGLLRCCDKNGNIDISPIKKLLSIMKEAPVYSIDTLALENPEYSGICQHLTSAIIIEKLREQIRQDHSGVQWDFAQRRLAAKSDSASSENWIHLFTAMMRNSVARDKDSRFLFISFNYDRIVQHTMSHIWRLSSRDIGPFEEIADFCYPHGQIGWTVDERSQSKFDYLGEGIQFAHNKIDRSAFNRPTEWLNKANTVISLGFHFAPENIESLNIRSALKSGKLIYQNYDRNEGLDRRVAELGLPAFEKFDGPISKAILQGKLGLLPS